MRETLKCKCGNDDFYIVKTTHEDIDLGIGHIKLVAYAECENCGHIQRKRVEAMILKIQ